MTYSERIAAAQEKMAEFKAKMAETADKASAAHEMKKEELDAAIKSIGADIDELNADIADEFKGGIADSMVDTATEIDDTVEGGLNAADENYRLAKERRDSKIYSYKLQAQMKAEALKEKLADREAEKDKAAMESYIIDLLEYAECCQQVAYAAAIEADMTLLAAADVAAEYNKLYGEPAADEAE